MFDVRMDGGLLARRWLVAFSVLAAGELTVPCAARPGPLPWRVGRGDPNGLPAGEPGWLLPSEATSPAGMSPQPAALDTVHVARTAPDGMVLFPSDVCTIDPDELGRLQRLTAPQRADSTRLTGAGLAPSRPFRVRLRATLAAGDAERGPLDDDLARADLLDGTSLSGDP